MFCSLAFDICELLMYVLLLFNWINGPWYVFWNVGMEDLIGKLIKHSERLTIDWICKQCWVIIICTWYFSTLLKSFHNNTSFWIEYISSKVIFNLNINKRFAFADVSFRMIMFLITINREINLFAIQTIKSSPPFFGMTSKQW